MAGEWNPLRLTQVWNCGWWLSGGSGNSGDCDPISIMLGEEPERLADREASLVLERLLVFVTVVGVITVPAGITWAKGQRVAFFLGFFLLGMVWVVAACRLARPESWWARRFYGPEKVQRAANRFDAGDLPRSA